MSLEMPSRPPIVLAVMCFYHIGFCSCVMDIPGNVCHMRRNCEPFATPQNACKRPAVQP